MIRPKVERSTARRDALTSLALPGVLLVGAVVFPFAVRAPFYIHMAILIFMFAGLGQAWNVLGGYTGQVSLGHAVFFGIGAYTSTMLFELYALTPWAGMFVGGAFAALASVVIGLPCFRLSGHYFAIATLAIGEIVLTLFKLWGFVGKASGIYMTITSESWLNFQFHTTKVPYYFISLGLFLLAMAVTYLLSGSKFGYYFKAIRDDQDAARSLGINPALYKMLAMGVSAFLSGMLGTFYAQYLLFIDPPSVFALMFSIQICLIAIMGGVGTLWGPLIGALVMIPISEYSRAYFGGTGHGVDLAVYGGLIVIIAAFRPSGLIGLLTDYAARWGLLRRPAEGVEG